MAVVMKNLEKVGSRKGKGKGKEWPKYKGRFGKPWACYLFSLRFGKDGKVLGPNARPDEVDNATRLSVGQVLALWRSNGLGQAPGTISAYLSQAERDPATRASWFKWDGVSDPLRDEILTEINTLDPATVALMNDRHWRAAENARCREGKPSYLKVKAPPAKK